MSHGKPMEYRLPDCESCTALRQQLAEVTQSNEERSAMLGRQAKSLEAMQVLYAESCKQLAEVTQAQP